MLVAVASVLAAGYRGAAWPVLLSLPPQVSVRALGPFKTPAHAPFCHFMEALSVDEGRRFLYKCSVKILAFSGSVGALAGLLGAAQG